MSAELAAAAPGARRNRGLLGLAALACVALQFPGTLPLAAAALVLWIGLLAVFHRALLGALWKPKFWAFTLALALASGLLLGPRQASGVWSVVSRQGLEAGLLMVLRGALIFALTSWASRAVSGDEIQRAAGKVGLPGLGTAMATALALLPGLSMALRRMRHPAGEGRLRRLRSSAVWLVLQTARLAQDMARGSAAGDALDQRFGTGRPLLAAVVGSPGSGKTTRVMDLAQRLTNKGLRVGGLVQPVEYENDQRLGYGLRDVFTGEQRPLAQRLPEGKVAAGLGFSFDPATWIWAHERLLEAGGQAQVLVLDELGRLEARGEGHMPALLEALGSGGATALLLAVREDQAHAIQERLGKFNLVLTPDASPEEEEGFLFKLMSAAAETGK